MPKKNGLTPKQAAFVQEYLIDLNATQAAIRAGYSERSAKEQAARLLTNDNVKDAVERAQKARDKRVELTQDYVLKNVIEILEACRASDDQSNALRASELLGRHLAMWTDKKVVGADQSLKEFLAGVSESSGFVLGPTAAIAGSALEDEQPLPH